MILITLTLIIWMTIALRQLSLMTSQGQSFIVFLKMTALAMPNLIAVVAPVALLISALHTLNRLSGDSELIVLSASGATVWRVLRPYLALAAVVAAFVLATNAYIAPIAMRVLREYTIKVRTDLIGQVLQPGDFPSPEAGLTVHIAERAANGDLLGLMIHDEREKSQIMTYLAELAQFVKENENESRLIMYNGHILRANDKNRDVQVIVFDRYSFDLSQFSPKEGARDYKPRERTMDELFHPDATDKYYKNNAGKFRAELHDRLSNPLYSFLFMIIAVVHLGYPRTTRDSGLQAIFIAFAVCAALRVVGLTGVNMLAKNGAAVLLVWGVPVIGIIGATLMAHYQIKPLSLPSLSLPGWLRRRTAAQPA